MVIAFTSGTYEIIFQRTQEKERWGEKLDRYTEE